MRKAAQHLLCAGSILALCVSAAGTAAAQTSDNLLLVVNEDSPASVRIGEYYAAKRGVAADHVVRLKLPVADTLERADYVARIEGPIAATLGRLSLQDQILYIVLTKGVPLRIAGTGDRDGTLASVDSELTLLYRKLAGVQSSVGGRVDNPYYLGGGTLSDAKPFVRQASDIYLVTRLDGYTAEDVIGLIDRGVAPASQGVVVLDERASESARSGGDQWLEEASDRLRAMADGDRVLLETTRSMAATQAPAIGYYSWGSNDPALQVRRTGLTFAPGAIGGMFVSTAGRTFAEPPSDWTPTSPNGLGRPFAGTFESLAGDLVRDGMTGVSAAVAEPFLDATIRPQILFPAYAAGFNLAEAFYLATPFLSWRTIVIGDPLCRPFARAPVAPEQLVVAIDPETELPALLSARRLENIARASSVKPEALKLWLKIESRIAHGVTDVTDLLLQSIEIDPRLMPAQQRLAELYSTSGDYSKALDRYRQILAVEPTNLVALNNSAYLLSERLERPAEALPFAERAYAATPSPPVADTLGWIHHMLGNDRTALPFLERAAAGKTNADTLVHLAVVQAALGNSARATESLEAAGKLDDRLSDRADVKNLRQRLTPGAPTPAAP